MGSILQEHEPAPGRDGKQGWGSVGCVCVCVQKDVLATWLPREGWDGMVSPAWERRYCGRVVQTSLKRFRGSRLLGEGGEGTWPVREEDRNLTVREMGWSGRGRTMLGVWTCFLIMRSLEAYHRASSMRDFWGRSPAKWQDKGKALAYEVASWVGFPAPPGRVVMRWGWWQVVWSCRAAVRREHQSELTVGSFYKLSSTV